MILYFTSTGNSLSVAHRIAATTGDGLFDMGAATKHGDFDVTLANGENLGIVFPTYRWSTPPLVDKFVKNMSLKTQEGGTATPGYVFTVETYGHFPGRETNYLARELEKFQHLRVDGSFSVHSVGDCLYLFNTPDDRTVDRKLEAADRQASHIAAQISAKKTGDHAASNPIGSLLSCATGTEVKKRSTSHFNVDIDKCTGCGTCARICPTNSVKIVEGHPVWSGDDCTECLACIQHCPQGASQYGKATVGRRRYLNPEVFKTQA